MIEAKPQLEAKLKHNIVKWHSQTYPERHGALWEVNNDTHGMKQAMHRRAMGMISGVADLHIIAGGRSGAIELKAPGSRHGTEHIRNQFTWGAVFAENGGWYIMSSDEIEIREFMQAFINGEEYLLASICNSALRRVLAKLEQGNKSVTF